MKFDKKIKSIRLRTKDTNETIINCYLSCENCLYYPLCDILNGTSPEMDMIKCGHGIPANEYDFSVANEFANAIKGHARKMCSSDWTGEFWDAAVLVEDINNELATMKGDMITIV